MQLSSIIIKRMNESILLYNSLGCDHAYIDNIQKLCNKLLELPYSGGKVILFGNGGSHCQSSHLATELLIRYKAGSKRPALPAICISSDSGIITAASNDYSFCEVFSRQIDALTTSNDIIIGFSTSGQSENFINGIHKASMKAGKENVFSIIGSRSSEILEDNSIVISNQLATTTALCQEFHLFTLHCACELLEYSFNHD
jgi:D-sedoheptulose 7-phosphate isomerase